MNITIIPSRLQGRVTAPPSKSHAHRLLIAAALCGAGEETQVLCPGENEDISATVRCLTALGAEISRNDESFKVRPAMHHPAAQAVLDCGESGSTLRFLLPLGAVSAQPDAPLVFTGSGRLPDRPNDALLKVMHEHGACILGGKLPLRVGGGLTAGDYILPGNVSSQYFSGLLFALPLLQGDSKLSCSSPLESRPYVDLTLDVLRTFGISVKSMETGWLIPGGQTYKSPGSAITEGDWSAAAFWLGADMLGGSIAVDGLSSSSAQGDRVIQRLLTCIGQEIDVSDTPDLMPVLAIVAAAAQNRTTRITGAARLRLKESDRISAMAQSIQALGGCADETADGLVIHGCALTGGSVNGQNDHRIVMSAAVAAAACRGPVTITGAEAVSKSYPRFWQDFKALGGVIHG